MQRTPDCVCASRLAELLARIGNLGCERLGLCARLIGSKSNEYEGTLLSQQCNFREAEARKTLEGASKPKFVDFAAQTGKPFHSRGHYRGF